MAAQCNNRQRMVAALAALHGDDLRQLADYGTETEALGVGTAYGTYEKIEVPLQSQVEEQQIHSLVAGERFSGLAEIHPAWILEQIKDEPPRIIGIILRYLPSQHVRYVIEHLAPVVRDALPDMVEAFAVSTPVLSIIRCLFERRFFPMRISHTLDHYGFEQLYYLKSDELEVLLRDLGIHEMAMALSRMSSKALRILLNRLPLKEAKQLQRRIRTLGDVSEGLRRQAQFTVLGAAGERLGSRRLLLEIGLAALARSLAPDQDDLFRALQQKLDPVYGYVLKRALGELAGHTSPDLIQERQALVLDRVSVLSHEKSIDASWGRLFAVEEDMLSAGELA